MVSIIFHTPRSNPSPIFTILRILFVLIRTCVDFQLANYHCRVTSFTPVCYHFAVSLAALVDKVCDCFELPQKHPEAASQVSKTMITLLEQVPFHR